MVSTCSMVVKLSNHQRLFAEVVGSFVAALVPQLAQLKKRNQVQAHKDLDHGRCLHDGRLRCRAGAVLREHGVPFGDTHKHGAAYLGRLMERPSFARAVQEAQPYLARPEVD